MTFAATVLTLYPEMFPGHLGQSIAGRALNVSAVEVEPPWRWLREFAQLFFARLCQTQDALKTMSPPLEDRISLVASAPPFAGVEYVTARLLECWWKDLAGHISCLAKDGVETWLIKECPAWHVVGRVTFHLAENKTDTQRPFAFLATFTEKLGAGGQPQHLPLVRALQMYANQKDQVAIATLLAPVRRAAETSQLLREWLESKRLFTPMAMSAKEAYRVLKPGGYFLYADFRFSDGIAKWETAIHMAPLKLKQARDISPEVLRGMECNSARSVELLDRKLPKFLHGLGRDFAGVKGSRVYNALLLGGLSYRSYCFLKV